jgi:hypothetical protein
MQSSSHLMVLLLVAGAGAATGLHIMFGARVIPHPAKVDTGGEDAFFFDDRIGTFGVADGVGGSARDHVDPGAFSREILRRCHLSAASGGMMGVPKINDILQTASGFPISLGGSSTLILGQLQDDTLRLINLGDSGAMLLRPSLREFGDHKVLFPRCVLRTQDQNHGFVSGLSVSLSLSHDALHFCPAWLPAALPLTRPLDRASRRRTGRTRPRQTTLLPSATKLTNSQHPSVT